MSISNEVSRLETAKANLRTAINSKGVSVSETATLDTYATAVNSIATASSVDLSGYMPKSGGNFTGLVKFNETDGACINFDSGFYINKQGSSTLLGTNGTIAWVGMPAATLTFRGSAARPSYVYNGTTYTLARTSDITTYTLPTATSSVLGGVKIGSNITVSSGTISLTKANVTSALGYTPPTTNTTYSIATASTAGLVKPVSVITKPTLQSVTTTSGRYYQVQMSTDGNMFVNVPWSDTNTTYSSLKNPYSLTIQANGSSLGTYDGSSAKTFNLTYSNVGAAAASHSHSYLPLSGGNVSGHIYLTGANESSSTGNTSQIVFGTSSNNHVAISSNNNALVISPTTSSTENQIVLYLDKASVFPSGISANVTGNLSGNASSASSVPWSGVTNKTTETWTFTLSDGSTVTKKICIG